MSIDNHTDSKMVAMSKQRRSTERSKSGVDLRDTLNAKRSQEEDLRAKLNGRKAVAINKVVPASAVVCMAHSEQKEAASRYQTLFSLEIEGLDPPKKFTPLRLTLYDEKSNPRSQVNHVRQMMALQNHMNALMCQVFSSSLGDLELK